MSVKPTPFREVTYMKEIDEKIITDVYMKLQILLYGHHVFFEFSHISKRIAEPNTFNTTFEATNLANGLN